MFRRYAIATLVIVGIIALACTAFAADAGKTEEVQKQSLFDIINAGGFIGYFIITLNAVAIGLGIEYGISMRRSVIMPPEILSDIEDAFEKEDHDRAMQVCDDRPTVFTNIIAAGISRMNLGHTKMEEAMTVMAEEGQVTLQQKLGWLALIANLGPMLGLMGTTISMIEAFGQLAQSTAPKPAEIAAAIQLALVTTFLGLMTAVVAQSIFHFFKNKAQNLVLECVAVSNELMVRFSSPE